MSDQPKGPQVFRPVFGYEGLYEVSDLGNIRNTFTGKFLTPYPIFRNNSKYYFVSLYRKGELKTTAVHRIVAKSFLGNIRDREVNHIDRDTSNNKLSNLEWVTRQYNMEYSISKTYFLKSPEGEVVEIFNLEKFARDNLLDSSNLNKVFAGKRKHHKGWTTIHG